MKITYRNAKFKEGQKVIYREMRYSMKASILTRKQGRIKDVHVEIRKIPTFFSEKLGFEVEYIMEDGKKVSESMIESVIPEEPSEA